MGRQVPRRYKMTYKRQEVADSDGRVAAITSTMCQIADSRYDLIFS